MDALTAAQLEILKAVAADQGRWWSAMEVVGVLGYGTGPGIGCAMKGLVRRGLLRYRSMARKEGRRQASYQIVAAGMDEVKRRSASCGIESTSP